MTGSIGIVSLAALWITIIVVIAVTQEFWIGLIVIVIGFVVSDLIADYIPPQCDSTEDEDDVS